MPKTVTRWSIRGQYFENCNCDVVCPCEVSALGRLRRGPIAASAMSSSPFLWTTGGSAKSVSAGSTSFSRFTPRG